MVAKPLCPLYKNIIKPLDRARYPELRYQIHLYSICRVDIEKYTRGLFEYVKEEFGEFQPQMSEPGTIPDMPDYLDIVLCKKDGSIFYEMDIQRRAINIPLDFQLEGLVLEINITNCDGTKYKKTHQFLK